MDRIEVELLSHSPIRNIITGARTCWRSFSKDDYVDEENIGKNNEKLLKTLINLGHLSVAEHLYYTFRIKKVSRLFLQELARHRIASLSVESTRYTLKKVIQKLDEFNGHYEKAVKYFCVCPPTFDNEDYLDLYKQILTLRNKIEKGYDNDTVKYFLPESWRTEIIWTINVRSLRNFLKLRMSKKAHFEIRLIAYLIVDFLPENHKFLYQDILMGED